MKVCILTLYGKGGMIHYASQLANALSRTNNIVYAVIPENSTCDYFEENVRIAYIPYPKNIFSWESFNFYSLIQIIENIKPDVIHITIKHAWLIPTLFFLKKIPIVTTIHDVKNHPGDGNDFLSLLGAISLWMLKRFSDKLFVHGNKLKNELIKEGVYENKITIIPHGDYSFFTKYKKDNIKEENAILFFGRVLEYKRIDYLIKAEPLITKNFHDIKIIIAGRGDFSKYGNMIEQNHKKKFEIINKFIPDEQVADIFQKSKIVVLPYIEASQSGVIPIAYAFKKPVVATSVGSIPEIVDDGVTGFIVPPKDAKILAEAIIRLLGDEKLRKEMGENAYKKMKEELSWDKIADQTIEVYKKAINEHNNKRRK